MEQQELTKEQEDFKQEQIAKGVAFQELIRTKGFEYQKSYLKNSITSFINQVMADERKPISEFESLRQQIIGIKKMFGDIEWSVNELEKDVKNGQSR